MFWVIGRLSGKKEEWEANGIPKFSQGRRPLVFPGTEVWSSAVRENERGINVTGARGIARAAMNAFEN